MCVCTLSQHVVVISVSKAVRKHSPYYQGAKITLVLTSYSAAPGSGFKWPVAVHVTWDERLWETRSAAVFVAVGCSREGEVQSLWTGGKTSSSSPGETTDWTRWLNLKADYRRRRNGRESEVEQHTVSRFVVLTPVSWLTTDSVCCPHEVYFVVTL